MQQVREPRDPPAKVLILGSSGMVGRSWCHRLDLLGIPFRAVSRPDFDLLQPDSLLSTVRGEEELVVNASAWTDVDAAEEHVEKANKANGTAVGILADQCKELDSTLIHYSTDYVFDGISESPYKIDAPINPCNAYGESKALGENAIRDSGCDHLIIRTSWVYAPWGKNFVKTIAALAKDRDELSVVDDQRGRPTSAEQLAKTSIDLYINGACGTWHATDGGECTWHEFASRIAAETNPACTVNPCSSDQYPRPAFRPPYSVLDISQTEVLCGEQICWEENLQRVLNRIQNNQ
jgi:dTDP-4-dehydrorhamnose reductase